jgi:hypothetical protein
MSTTTGVFMRCLSVFLLKRLVLAGNYSHLFLFLIVYECILPFFHSCGSENFSHVSSPGNRPYVLIDHSEGVRKQIWLSPLIHKIGNQKSVTSLQELSMRAAYSSFKNGKTQSFPPSLTYYTP